MMQWMLSQQDAQKNWTERHSGLREENPGISPAAAGPGVLPAPQRMAASYRPQWAHPARGGLQRVGGEPPGTLAGKPPGNMQRRPKHTCPC